MPTPLQSTQNPLSSSWHSLVCDSILLSGFQRIMGTFQLCVVSLLYIFQTKTQQPVQNARRTIKTNPVHWNHARRGSHTRQDHRVQRVGNVLPVRIVARSSHCRQWQWTQCHVLHSETAQTSRCSHVSSPSISWHAWGEPSERSLESSMSRANSYHSLLCICALSSNVAQPTGHSSVKSCQHGRKLFCIWPLLFSNFVEEFFLSGGGPVPQRKCAGLLSATSRK